MSEIEKPAGYVEAGKDYPDADQTRRGIAKQIDADQSANTPDGKVDGRRGKAETGSKQHID